MKKIFTLFLLFLMLFGISSCFSTNESDGGLGSGSTIVEVSSFRVYFVIDGKARSYKEVNNMQIFTPPSIPKKTNYTVVGWINEQGILHDFTKPLKQETTLYAKYDIDYKTLVNLVSTTMMSSHVQIEVTIYNMGGFLGLTKKNVSSKSGSGIIFHDQHDNYYVITNAHVTSNESRKHIDIKVKDYKGRSYTAYKHENAEQDGFDLSVIYFKKPKEMLQVVDIAHKNPLLNQAVISLGQPQGQNNTITFGIIKKYEIITLSSGVSLPFEVINHSAPTDSGSSGGAILDLELNLVGVHFAGSKDYEGNFKSGYAIPAETIQHYLKNYVWIKQTFTAVILK